jgi:hypothetical protein
MRKKVKVLLTKFNDVRHHHMVIIDISAIKRETTGKKYQLPLFRRHQLVVLNFNFQR